jgi:hypothetical protein
LSAFVRGSGQSAPRDAQTPKTLSRAARIGLAERVAARLKDASPMMIQPAAEVHAALAREGMGVSLLEMRRILDTFPDRFEILPARDGELILLRKSRADAKD